MVEDEQRVGEHEYGFRQAQRVVGRGRDARLEVARHLVAQVAHGAAREARQSPYGDRLEARDLLLDSQQRVAGASRVAQRPVRLRADEGSAPDVAPSTLSAGTMCHALRG